MNKNQTPLTSKAVKSNIPIECGIYKITCQATNLSYVGKASDLRSRLLGHISNCNHLNPRRATNKLIKADWDKYGQEHFVVEFLEITESAKSVQRQLQYARDF